MKISNFSSLGNSSISGVPSLHRHITAISWSWIVTITLDGGRTLQFSTVPASYLSVVIPNPKCLMVVAIYCLAYLIYVTFPVPVVTLV